VLLVFWLFIRFFFWNCTNKKYKKLTTAKALAVTTAATTTQFNLSVWKLISGEPIKLPTTDIL
jgi:hypothetical protein